jgi:CHAT domain-containing protein/tetratricopeptide (TPR) repeat protein
VAGGVTTEAGAVQVPWMRWPAGLVGVVLLIAVVALGNGAAVAQGGGQDDIGNRLESLRAEGRYSEAITVLKRVVSAQEAKSGLDNAVGVALLNNLGELHYKLGLYAEATPIYERALAIADKTIQVDNPLTATLLRNLGIVYQLQGRRGGAARLYARSIQQFEKLMPATRIQLASSLNNLATLYQDLGRLSEAEPLLVRVVETYRDGLPAGHPYISTGLNNLGLLHLAQRELGKAELTIAASLRNIDISLDRDHPQRAPLLVNLGRVYLQKADWGKAVDVLGQAVDVLQKQERRGAETLEAELSGLPRTDVESHKNAVAFFVFAATNLVVRDQSAAQSRGVEIVGQLLDVAQRQPSAASASLAQMSVRRMKGEGPLVKRVRERQDLVLEWQAHNKRLFDRLIKGGDTASKDRITAADQARLNEIDRRIVDLDRALARDFPDYASLINPPPLNLGEVYALLRDDEALVTFLETPIQVWTWVISKSDKGLTLFNIGSDALVEEVAALRCGLDPLDWVDPAGWPAETGADRQRKQQQEQRLRRCRSLYPGYSGSGPLPFDARRAHGLYKALLGGVEKETAGKHLLIVPSASLTQLPFGTLVTEMPGFGVPLEIEGYRAIKWLGTRQPITILPSIASLAVLRRSARASAAPKAWIGFGNPLLEGISSDPEQGRQAVEARVKESCGIGGQRLRIAARRARAAISDVFQGGPGQGALGDVALLRRQPPLPETADELCDVAKRLGASDEDVWLGAKATEAAVKRLSARGILSGYATLHFATHGLVAGALKGLAEPALMLTPPAAPSEEDDGLLTASEVTQLKLDADWVVLSACNTAAGGAEGAEALSGLARAFFYAGARALLVSHWEVESGAAVALTTGAFAAAQKDPRIGRAEALRRSMLALSTDQADPRNAHPSVWAPFVLVGEGGR